MPSPNNHESGWRSDLFSGLLDGIDLIEVLGWMARAVCHVVHAILTCHF